MKTLFVDFDGTICFDRFWQNLSYDEYALVEDILFKQNRDMIVDWMRGTYTAEDINHFVSEKTGIPYERLWGVFVDGCKSMVVSQDILKQIDRLRGRYYTVLVTGNMDSFDRFTVPSLKLAEYFDIIVNSYTEQVLKFENDGATFKKYLKGNMNDAILIEDSQKSCDTFERLGGTVYQVTHEHSALSYLTQL
jgi:FMN phosphatase YigB (HAD superfamily)